FLGDADAGQRSAILYTIIESFRCRGIDPYAYLRDVLTRQLVCAGPQCRKGPDRDLRALS
ncbi:MAG: hypothetical protein WCD63_05510, partial [Terrimicrobiaceae bacterium]